VDKSQRDRKVHKDSQPGRQTDWQERRQVNRRKRGSKRKGNEKGKSVDA
jgi:hypothetical protein